jgi:predicted transcriptional regulator
MGTIENIELLARSAHRVRILDLLCEHGSLEKHALGSELDASRTTVGRNLSALEEQGWIRRTNAHCEITRQGELVAEAFGDLVETVEMTGTLNSFLQWIPDGSLDLDLRLLRDADIVLAKPGDPRSMINRHVQTIKEMEQGRGYVFTPTQLREQSELVKSSRCLGQHAGVGRRDCVPAGSTSPAGTAWSHERTSHARCEASR